MKRLGVSFLACNTCLTVISLTLVIFNRAEEDDDIPIDFSANLEIPVEHFGLVDDYGVKPQFPWIRQRAPRVKLMHLAKAGKTKRDGADVNEFYDNF
nr:PREDICTED: uncharacterized protein C11orf94 homolog [Latimeria chalumnae]|eukprot:XP_014343593.1 PREDICTED: uncharacterized protein C11orf94 homolog [Latimeria chalumnae]